MFKILAIIILVALGIYLFKRAKRLAEEEQQQALNESLQKRREEYQTVAKQEAEAKAKAEADKDVIEGEVIEQLASEQPEAVAEEPVKEESPLEFDVDGPTAADEQPEAEAVPQPACEPETLTEAPAEDEPVAEVDQAELDTSWATAELNQALSDMSATSDILVKHQAMLAAIAECYKQRKQTQYLDFGAHLSDEYSPLFADYIKQEEANGNLASVKGIGFMQLATLLTDHAEFDRAIGFCHQAIGYELSDGTKTGFEGRLVRIEKAKLKAEKA